jgi:excisionase family DNA binding protein
MLTQNINLVHVTLEDMANTLREIVASELQKIKNLIPETPKDETDKVLTREEVCKLLGVSFTTLFNWNNEGILKNYKVGRRVYYKKSDVMAILSPLKAVS